MQRFSLILIAAFAAVSASAAHFSEPDIYSAIRSGDTRRMQQLLDRGLDPNTRDREGNTLLMQGAVYGRPDLLRLLLDRGAEVNATNQSGATALMRAANDPAKVRLLLEKGADVNASSAFGNTALLLAVRVHGNSETVATLIKHGASPHATNIWGMNALVSAAAGSDAKTVRLLLEQKVSPNPVFPQTQEAMLWGGGRSPLMWAAFRNDVPMIDLLLEHGADLHGQQAFGTALSQAAWIGNIAAARRLIEKGADVNEAEMFSGFTPLHWAASIENGDAALVKLLLQHGAKVNAEGGEPVDAYLGVPQTPLMLAERRGETPIVAALRAAGATSNPDRPKNPPARREIDATASRESLLRAAIGSAVPALQTSALISKDAFVSHTSQQNCVSCHQQHLPLAALSFAKGIETLRKPDEQKLLDLVLADNEQMSEIFMQALFHPEAVHSVGYALLSLGLKGEPANSATDALVHHLLSIQGKDGQWHVNLSRPPLQTSDVGATALAIHGLIRYPFPARQAEFNERITRGRRWLEQVGPANTEERAFQLLGLAWAGKEPAALKSFARALIQEQREDGGWAQLPGLASDAYATGQSLYALHVAGLSPSAPEFKKGIQFLLETQLEDGSWFVARRAFPFQPTMKSGFPHGRDSWISASGTSWATIALALALPENTRPALTQRRP